MSSKSVYYYDFFRSCDAEDWSKDAENTALITGINLKYCIFDQINASLTSISLRSETSVHLKYVCFCDSPEAECDVVHRAFVYLSQNNYADAHTCFSSVLKLDPKNPVVS